MALLLCLHSGDSQGTSLVPTRTPSHVHVLSKGLSGCVLAPPPMDTQSFVAMSLGSPHSYDWPRACFPCFSLWPSSLEFSVSGMTFQAKRPTVSLSASGLRAA